MSNTIERLPVKDPRQWRRGWATNPRHSGIDYGWIVGDVEDSKRIYNVAAGRVESVTSNGSYTQGWGNRVWVQVTDRAAVTYSHMRTGSVSVSRGQIIGVGHYIGSQGSTGEARGDHLHLELYIDGQRVDPAPYMNGGKVLPGTPVVGGGNEPAGGATFAQRTVRSVGGGFINGRISPTTGASIRQKLNSGVTGNFDQFIRGESVSQNGVTTNIWFRGAFAHNWFWAGNFTSQDTAGMADAGTFSAPAPLRQYVRIPEPYIWYDHPDDAARAVDRRYSVPAGDYLLIRVDPRGPRLIQWGNSQVWVGSTRTQPPIITK